MKDIESLSILEQRFVETSGDTLETGSSLKRGHLELLGYTQ